MAWLTSLFGSAKGVTSQPPLGTPAFKANPFPHYARLRNEGPVHRLTIPDGQTAYFIVRYDDVAGALKDTRLAKDRLNALTPAQLKKQPWMPKVFEPLTHNMLDQDPPHHSRLRGLVNKAFTPKLIEQMGERIQRLTDELLDARRNQSEFDVIQSLALPLPTTVIAEMLGVPRPDWPRFQRWSNAIIAATSSKWGTFLMLPHGWAFLRYARRLAQSRRLAPGTDVVSALVQAEEQGQQLSEDELVAMIFLLLVAGHETTVNLIGNGLLALLQHPDELRRLREDPDLIKSAVEEMLRFTSPVEWATERFSKEHVSIDGTTIPQGSLVFAVLASAHRDGEQFPDPDRFDVTREPNKHLAFGLGAHYCLGASLARLEAQIAIGTLLRRTKEIKLATDVEKLRWRGGLILRGLKELPVQVR